MSTFLERYERGEHEKVWDELVALGADVYEEPLVADARAVARETMRRARANILTLIQRLGHIGYLFGYAFLQPPAYRSLGRSERDWLQRSLAWAGEQPPLLGGNAAELDEEMNSLRAHSEQIRQSGHAPLIADHMEHRLPNLESQKDQRLADLDAFEREIGSLPLSLRAWYEAVGGVNFVGLHVGWLRLLDPTEEDARQREEYVRGDVGIPFHRLAGLRPLFVPPLDPRRATRDSKRQGSWRFELLPDRWSLYGVLRRDPAFTSPCTIDLPQRTADVVMVLDGRETMTFVGYLRRCFRWGGFPGWDRAGDYPEQDVTYLTEGLLAL